MNYREKEELILLIGREKLKDKVHVGLVLQCKQGAGLFQLVFQLMKIHLLWRRSIYNPPRTVTTSSKSPSGTPKVTHLSPRTISEV